jgi:chemotaxis family two-component system sensor kinase Cph1
MTNHKSESQLLAEMQQFLHSAVHDLRAAQRRTMIAAEMLLQPSTEQERTDSTGQLLQGAAKTEQLLTAIGRYATALTPRRYSRATFPLSRAVRFALANLEGEIRETGATVTVGDLPEVPGDKDRLTELFEHLIENSLKFRAAEPPQIEIGAKRVGEQWVFFIKDNGLGIPEKYRERLFVAFRRLHGADVPGAGLGLAISRNIIEGHGGRIWIDPGRGPGVTFCFTLPNSDGD